MIRTATIMLLLVSFLNSTAEGQIVLKMPGKSHSGPLVPLAEHEKAIRDELEKHVRKLADDIGERSIRKHAGLIEAAAYIETTFTKAGHKTQRQSYMVRGRSCDNVEAEIKGQETPDEIVVIGAHYDSVEGTVGANDNGSGVAALLTLANAFTVKKPARTLRFVAFANEEPPYFQTELMGSLVYAAQCKQRREKIVGMISLETIGYYSDAQDSQRYPAPFSMFYPSTGNFIAFVGDVSSAELVKTAVESFRRHAQFPSEGGAVPAELEGVGWSDHWSFWQAGYPAIMVTDTAPFRYPYYHSTKDTPDKLDYDRMARVVAGLEKVIEELAGGRPRTPSKE